MAEDTIVKEIRSELQKKVGRGELLAGPGAKKIRKAQAFLRNMADEGYFAGNIKGAVRLRKVIRTNANNEKKLAYEPVIIKTPAHLRSINDNYLLDVNGQNSLGIQDDLQKIKDEIKMLLGTLKNTKNLNLEDRLCLNRMESQLNKKLSLLRQDSHSLEAEEGDSIESRTDKQLMENNIIGEDQDQFGSRIQSLADNMLQRQDPQASALQVTNYKIPQTAFHDFPSYVFIRKPGHVILNNDDFTSIVAELEKFLKECREIMRYVVDTYGYVDLDYLPEEYNRLIYELEEELYKLFLNYPATALFELQGRIINGTGQEVLDAFREWLIIVINNAPFDSNSVIKSCDNPELWKDAANQVREVLNELYPDLNISSYLDSEDNSYSFVPFDTSIVNFGLRIVYRQEWRPLGTQPGEIVRTIPLGPKQVEKVSTKIVISEKITRSAETVTSTETDSESSNTTKDSIDVVKESSKSFKFETGTEGGGSWGYFSAKASMGFSAETASSSKDAKHHLNETMAKTVSKMRNESKVLVSVEKSSSQEYSASSEIVNPNDEIAVTYVYSKLQRQYEIYTRLAEVNSVIFVPERVPEFGEINDKWVCKYAWVISKVLPDESFAEDLALIVNETEENEITGKEQEFYEDAAQEAKDNLGNYTSLQGTLPDIFIGPQEAYQKQMDKNRAIQAKNNQIKKRKERLINHIRTNILHYMRAIWSSEDPDQRLMRYSNIYAPTLWFPEFSQDLTDSTSGWYSCDYFPDLSKKSMRPLNDIINPAGPIGYVGNYAVFNMRSDSDLSMLNHALSSLRACYVGFGVVVTPSEEVVDTCAYKPKGDNVKYRLNYNGMRWSAIDVETGFEPDVTVDGNIIKFDGVSINFSAFPKEKTKYEVNVFNTGEIQDPELVEIKLNNPLPEPALEEDFFSSRLLMDMSYHIPEIQTLLWEENTDAWRSLSKKSREKIRQNYHPYLLKREHTRQLLLETNNLLLDIDVGKTPVLEDFKRLHRAIDVMKELEEYYKRKDENLRRILRIRNNDLSDPDIENLTVIQEPGTASQSEGRVNIVIPVGSNNISNEKDE